MSAIAPSGNRAASPAGCPPCPNSKAWSIPAKVKLQIPGQVENGTLQVQVGDAIAEIKIVPVYRPSLRELTARIQLPDYLHYPGPNAGRAKRFLARG